MTGRVQIHASCVALAGAAHTFGAPETAGILLIGESGAGKSDLALRLIAMGARLVADDRVDLALEAGVLTARAPARLAGLIEVRGAGILTLPALGAAPVVLAVALVAPGAVPRMPESRRYVPPAPLDIEEAGVPLVALAPFEASAPAKVAAAAAALVRTANPAREA